MNKIEQLSDLFKGLTCVDLSPTLENDIPRWPTHPPLVINQTCTHEHDGVYIQTVFMPEHIGAHVDAPAHLVPKMQEVTIEKFPSDCLFGRAVLYNIKDYDPQPGQRITAEEILQLEEKMGYKAEEGDIVLLNFGWDKYWTTGKDWKYYAKNQPGFAEDAAKLFADRKVAVVASDTVASDTPVVDGEEHFSYGHHVHWLPNKILIIEGLANLDNIPFESYFIATPLKIKNGSGSPIRPMAFF